MTCHNNGKCFDSSNFLTSEENAIIDRVGTMCEVVAFIDLTKLSSHILWLTWIGDRFLRCHKSRDLSIRIQNFLSELLQEK